MAEIKSPGNFNGRIGIGESSQTSHFSTKMVEITIKTIGPFPSSRLTVPSPIKVCDLRKLIAQNGNLSSQNLKLICRGNVLHDAENGDDVLIQLNNGDSLIVAAKPKPPPTHARNDLDDDEEDELKFQLPSSTSAWNQKLFCLLRDKLKLPDIMMMGIFSLSIKMWIIILVWFVLAPVAHRFEFGPLYILGTGFTIIFYNLGKRQPGDVSAYSIFNEDFRELPGTLNAERFDRDIRAGQF